MGGRQLVETQMRESTQSYWLQWIKSPYFVANQTRVFTKRIQKLVNTAKKLVNSRHCCHAPMVALDGKSKSRVSYGSATGHLRANYI